MLNPLEIWDVVVVGSGPAGLSAALAARAEGAKVLVLERESTAGGILRQCIHNGFGQVLFKEDMPGPRFAAIFVQRCQDAGISILTETMVIAAENIEPNVSPARFRLSISGSNTGIAWVRSRSLVLALGCRERTRAQIMLPGDRGAGVFTAGTVQRLVNIDGLMPGNEFVILGSGDIGMIMARRLTLEGAKVKRVLEIQPWLTGLRRNYVQCLQDFDIPLSLSTTVTRVIGRDRVHAVETSSGELIVCDTLMLSVGLIPENELTRSLGARMDALSGGPEVDQAGRCSIPGLYAAGNVVGIYDLADWVSMAGSRAGQAAVFDEHNPATTPDKKFTIQAGKGVRSVMPQIVSIPVNSKPNDEKIRIDFRVAVPVENKVSAVLSPLDPHEFSTSGAASVLRKAALQYARPAEMLTLSCPVSDFGGPDLPEKLWVHIL